jgi:hypothetical protein
MMEPEFAARRRAAPRGVFQRHSGPRGPVGSVKIRLKTLHFRRIKILIDVLSEHRKPPPSDRVSEEALEKNIFRKMSTWLFPEYEYSSSSNVKPIIRFHGRQSRVYNRVKSKKGVSSEAGQYSLIGRQPPAPPLSFPPAPSPPPTGQRQARQ